MGNVRLLAQSLLLLLAWYHGLAKSSSSEQPNVMIALIVRNAENILPYVLGGLEIQNYPAKRLQVWIRTDCNLDGTGSLLKKWEEKAKKVYGSVDLQVNPCERQEEKFPFAKDWPRQRTVEIFRDAALDTARTKNMDYVMFLDSSSFLVNSHVLEDLVKSKRDLIGPYLPSLSKYGNFWCNTTDQGRFRKSYECDGIFEFDSVGIFDVGLVHGAFLVDVKSSRSASLKFTSSDSEMRPYQQFILSVYSSGASFSVINERQYGYTLPPLTNGSSFVDQADVLRNLQLEILMKNEDLPLSQHASLEAEDPDTLEFDHVYLINLDRRSERRKRLERSFEILGLEVERTAAVDGKNLTQKALDEMKVVMLPGYEDPYKKRPMTMGEYGCFLSHFAIWNDMLVKGFTKILVVEDDIRFDFFFRQKMLNVWEDIARLSLEWDLIYIGRKRLIDESEPYVRGSRNLVHVGYSYWTLCYMLSSTGAQKLLAGQPLTKMLPVDEYLPIMFDRHVNEEWKNAFPTRNLVAFSAYPLLVYPTHYTGEPGYISDTENLEVPHPALPSKHEQLESHVSHDEL